MLIFNTQPKEYIEDMVDPSTGELVTAIRVEPGKELRFEHSLKSISIWEAKYKRSFLDSKDKTKEEVLDYLTMMCYNHFIDVSDISYDIIAELEDYIGDSHSATVLSPSNSSNSRRTMTSERIYALMSNGQIPYTCDEWNIYNLLQVIGVLNEMNGPKKEMSLEEIYAQNERVNEERKRMMREASENENIGDKSED